MVSRWAAGRRLGLSGHALTETFSVLTRLPADARVSPADAVQLIDDTFPNSVALSVETAAVVHHELARFGVAGGAAYDGVVALAACEHEAVLATRDARARPTYESIGVAVEAVVGPEGGPGPSPPSSAHRKRV